MKRGRRQVLSLLALVMAGLASLATQQGPPGLTDEPRDRLSFIGDDRTEIRRVRLEVVAGEGNVHVWADVPIDTGGVNGKRPVVLTVIRDRDGKSVLDDFGPGYQAGFIASLAGAFVPIDSCASGETCTESFTFTFVRIPEDARKALEFDWSVRARAEYPDIDPAKSPPPGAALTVTISQ